MTILRIYQAGSHILREIAREVTEFDDALSRLADDMIETMHAKAGVGLAAPQVGRSFRLIVVDLGGVRLKLCNPVITRSSGQQRSIEGCLSVPIECWNKPIARYAQITVEYRDITGNRRCLNARKQLAAVLQHEADHLDGILFTDHIIGSAMAREVLS